MAKERLLLIADNPDLVEPVMTYFGARGFEVLHAANGEDGVVLAATESPDAILLDEFLNGTDCWQVARMLRANAQARPISVTYMLDDDPVEKEYAGFFRDNDDVVLRPFDPVILGLRLGATLHKTKANRA